jgi:hypothetical protein
MKEYKSFADSRALQWCIYCHGSPDTREHVPPKVMLDLPYPSNLQIVGACEECNNGHSVDEQYLACLIDCILAGSVNPVAVGRDKVRKALIARPKIAEKLSKARKSNDGNIIFDVEHERVERVVLKIALGHVLFELNELRDAQEAAVSICPLVTMKTEQKQNFENGATNNAIGVWPEVGSRAMQRLLIADKGYHAGWITVQEGRYRYAVSWEDGIEARMVFSEYLACVVRWPE